MALLKQINLVKFPTYSIGEYYIDPFQTTDATETVIGSFPVNQNQYVSVLIFEASAANSTHTSSVEANLQAAFLRASGNVARTSNSVTNGLVRNVFTSTGLTNSITIDAVANTSTNQIDFTVKGQVSITFNWNLFFRIKFEN